VVLGTGATVANAQHPAPKIRDIHAYVACLNAIQKQNQAVADAVRCVPPGCNYTVTMSGASAQPACTLDGVQLPRVIFSCPGPAAGLRFRPSFTLCPGTDRFPDAGQKTELGEDVDASANMKMADVENPTTLGVPTFSSITEFGTGASAVVSTTTNNKGCVFCHGPASPPTLTTPQGETLLLSRPFVPFFAILDTNDPRVTPPSNPTPLSDVCTAIENSTALANDPNVDRTLLIHLCERLDGKITGD